MAINIDSRELDALFDKATRTPEIAQKWVGLSDRQRKSIRDGMPDKVEALLESAKLETQRYEELRTKLSADRAQIEESLPRAQRWQTFAAGRRGWLIALAILVAIVTIAIDLARTTWPTWRDFPDRTWLWGPVAGTIVVAAILFLLLPALQRRHERRVAVARQNGGIALRLQETEQRVREARNAVLDAIRDNGMLSQLRAAIGAMAPAYSTTMPIVAVSGLSSAYQESLEVETPAHGELRNVLERWDRGSIGLAGPRGAGKSTLIRSFCRDRWAEDGNGGVLGVIASAPVEYQARDFLLHLFSLVCHRVQEWEETQHIRSHRARYDSGLRATYDRLDWKRHVTVPPHRTLWDGLRFISRLSLVAGILAVYCMIAAVALAYYAVPASPAPGASPAAAASAATPAASEGSSAASASSAAVPRVSAASASTPAIAAAASSATAGAESAAAAAPPSSAASTATSLPRLVLVLGELGIKASGLFAWSMWLALFWYVGYIALRSVVYRRFGRNPQEHLHSEGDYRLQAIRDARYWLAEIKFQHNFSAGWGGAVKIPIGLEASTTLGRSLAQAPLTLPEIVDGFTRFLTKVKTDLNCKIVIGIDELDKLADTEKAQRFLNEIKAIFDVDGVFYLVSVSEDAMSQFERRGLPFRDAFDSAFDKIIAADCLRFDDARRLIDERVVGMPIPFQALCYCLSGGLARELVRNCRELVNLALAIDTATTSDTGRTLAVLAGVLIQRHLDSKLKAVGHAAALLRIEPHRSALLMKVHRLRATSPTAAALHDARAELLAGLVPLAADGGAEATPSARFNALVEEIACYVYYLATLREFFSEALDADAMHKSMFRAGGEPSRVDALATILQSLSVSPGLAQSMLDSFRARA